MYYFSKYTYVLLVPFLYQFIYGRIFCLLLFISVNEVFSLLFMYLYYYACSVLCIGSQCVVLFIDWCKSLLYYGHRVSNQLQLTNVSYNTYIYVIVNTYIYLFISTQANKRENRCCRLSDSETAGVPVCRIYGPNCSCKRSAAR